MYQVDSKEQQLTDEEIQYFISLVGREPTDQEAQEFQNSLFCLGKAQVLYFQQKSKESNE